MRRIALLLLLLPAAPLNADLDTAFFFVRKARDALAEEDHDKAEHWCQRALEEEKDFAPALLALADIAQARGDRAQARKRLEACIAQDDEGLSGEERRAIRTARLQLKKLEPARFEFESLADEYVRKVLALARREAKKDPQLARECFRNVLLVDPTNAEAKGELESGEEGTPEGTPLFNGKDLEGWTGSEPVWTVRNGHLFGRVEDTANINRHKRDVRGDYSLVCELRVEEDIGDDPLFGIVFGVRGSYDHFGLWIWPESWRLEHQTGEHQRSDLARRTFRRHGRKYSRFDWNTYRIDVDEKRVTGFVNGRKIWSTSGAIRPLDGCVGFWVQEQAVEIRRFELIER